MKKFDMNTRQGRARRANRTDLFNPDTLQPHDAEHRDQIKYRKSLERKRK